MLTKRGVGENAKEEGQLKSAGLPDQEHGKLPKNSSTMPSCTCKSCLRVTQFTELAHRRAVTRNSLTRSTETQHTRLNNPGHGQSRLSVSRAAFVQNKLNNVLCPGPLLHERATAQHVCVHQSQALLVREAAATSLIRLKPGHGTGRGHVLHGCRMQRTTVTSITPTLARRLSG
jgi:hypothetical protein